MKKLILIVLCTIVSSPLFAQGNERWNPNRYTYTNFDYGFGWTLPKTLKWQKDDGQEMHTVFRASSGPFLVFVNCNLATENDLWDTYDNVVYMLELLDAYTYQKTGKLVYDRKTSKANLIGQHAIKSHFYEKFQDSRFDSPIEFYVEEFHVNLNGSFMTIAVKTSKKYYESVDCKEIIAEIFKGFRTAVKYQTIIL